ncbi:hypothetical protein COO60DRAFT_263444 [Scenedesmus sp. NREL 46B-D3]|nr:hypothetical protein COO60DRAFT_263444 [Scenedesmus sp. NREL 46B-D3]
MCPCDGTVSCILTTRRACHYHRSGSWPLAGDTCGAWSGVVGTIAGRRRCCCSSHCCRGISGCWAAQPMHRTPYQHCLERGAMTAWPCILPVSLCACVHAHSPAACLVSLQPALLYGTHIHTHLKSFSSLPVGVNCWGRCFFTLVMLMFCGGGWSVPQHMVGCCSA